MTAKKVVLFILVVLSLTSGCIGREEVAGLTVDDMLKYRQRVTSVDGPICQFTWISERPDVRIAHYSVCVPSTEDTEEKQAADEKRAAEELLDAIQDCKGICENAFETCEEKDACFNQCNPQ